MTTMSASEKDAIFRRNQVVLAARQRIAELKLAGRFVRAREMAQGVEIEVRISNFSKSQTTAFEIIPWETGR